MVISLLICHIITFGFTVYSLVWVLGQLRIKAGAQNCISTTRKDNDLMYMSCPAYGTGYHANAC